MATREAISKTVRFEVFKRDKFTCQYCGAKSPEVVLNVDHIQPVAKGGSNELLNLITSCHSCNNGKSDRTLSDGSMVEKQRRQLELLAERREQIDLMLQWKESLSSFDQDVIEMISDYVSSKIQPLTLNETGKASVAGWLKKHGAEQILDAIDTSAKQYLRYDKGNVEHASAELFIKKVGGILIVKNLPPIQQKLAYIKGIARNRFSYWDDKKASIILRNYLSELEKHYDDAGALDDLEKEVTRITKTSKNWTEWKTTLEKWTEDIKGWHKKSQEPQPAAMDTEYSLRQLESLVETNTNEQDNSIQALEHIGSLFPAFDKLAFRQLLASDLIEFLTRQNNFDKHPQDEEQASDFIDSHVVQHTQVVNQFEFDGYLGDHLGALIALEPIAHKLLSDIFSFCYYPKSAIKREYLKLMVEIHIEEIKAQAAKL